MSSLEAPEAVAAAVSVLAPVLALVSAAAAAAEEEDDDDNDDDRRSTSARVSSGAGKGASTMKLPLSVTTGPALAAPPGRKNGAGEPRRRSARSTDGAAAGTTSMGTVGHCVSRRGCSLR